MRIDLLLLDVDGVLVQYQRAQRVLHLAQALDVSADAVQAALYDSGLEAAHDSGALDGTTYLARLGERLGRSVDVPTWTAARQAASHPQDAVLQARASERGGGLACWLEIMRAVRNGKPARDVLFVASSGHELGHLGLAAARDLVDHLGAELNRSGVF